MNLIPEQQANKWISAEGMTPYIGQVVAVVVLDKGTNNFYYDFARLIKHTKVSELEYGEVLTKVILHWESSTTGERVDVYYWLEIPESPVLLD